MLTTKIFLSTDGKHTIQVETDGDVDPEAALEIAEDLYDKVEAKHGLKVDQWKSLNDKQQPAKVSSGPARQDAPTCGIHNVPMNWKPGGVSRTTGKPYNGFWSCNEKINGQFCNFRPGSQVPRS